MGLHAGPATGLIAYFLDCGDTQSLGKALDEVRAARSAGNPPPLARAIASPGAPFTPESASIRVEITPNEPGVPEPAPPRIGFTSNLRANPGTQAALLEVLAEAQQFHERLGGHVRIYNTTSAGPASGEVTVTTYVPTFEDRGRLADRNRAEGPGPLQQALQSANPPAVITTAATASGIDIS